jgi:hypothetical protein
MFFMKYEGNINKTDLNLKHKQNVSFLLRITFIML